MQWTFRVILTVLVLLGAVPQTAKAQFDRLTKLVNEIETADPDFRLSPSVIAKGAYQADKISYLVLEPLRWELEKLTIQESLLKRTLEESQSRWEEGKRALEATEEKLSEYRISSPDDLAKRNVQLEELNATLGEIDAEVDGLKLAQQEGKSNSDALVEKSRQDEILECQSKIVNSLTQQLAEGMAAVKKGQLSNRELREAELRLWEAEKLMANSKAAAKLAENGVQQEVIEGLRSLTHKRSALLDRLESLRATPSESEVRPLLRMKQRLEREDEIQRDKIGQYEQQLEFVAMERRFLEAILNAYEKASQEAAKSSAE